MEKRKQAVHRLVPAAEPAAQVCHGWQVQAFCSGDRTCRLHCPDGGARGGFGRHGGQHHHAQAFARTARAQAEQGVAVRHGVHRVDAARQAVVGRYRQAVGLHLGDHCVGGHHPDGGVGARQ